MAKITRTFLAAFVCAAFCSLCVATAAWADEVKPTDANGKWIPGTYEFGTVTVEDVHPGMEATAHASFPETPARNTYYSHGVSTLWYASEDGLTNWTRVGGGIQSITLPDEGEAGYEDVVNHYVKAVATHTYVVDGSYTSTGNLEDITFVAESEPFYVQPHENNGTWANDGSSHWLVCGNGPDSQCLHRINPETCQLASGDWFTPINTHEKWCTTCGGHYGPEKHCFNEYIVAYLEQNPQGMFTGNVHPTCDVCKQQITMSASYFWNEFVVPSGLVGNQNPSGDESEEPESPEGTTQEEPAPETGVTDGEEAPAPADGAADGAAKAGKADAAQATFARTNDAAPTHLLAAGTFAAAALAFIARKRLAA